MSCIRKQTIMEPLVDNVDQKQIVTNCQLLKVIRSNMVVFKLHFKKMSSNFAMLSSPRLFCGVVFFTSLTTGSLFLQAMDISKMASGDASFTVPFKLVAERDDYIHALVAYFDVSFTKSHKLTGFSTG